MNVLTNHCDEQLAYRYILKVGIAAPEVKGSHAQLALIMTLGSVITTSLAGVLTVSPTALAVPGRTVTDAIECLPYVPTVGANLRNPFTPDASEIAAAWTCADSAPAEEVEITGKLLAKATVWEATYALSPCTADGAYVCATNGMGFLLAANMVAQEYAKQWAEAITCMDKCSIPVDEATSEIRSILSEAVTHAYAEACSGGGLWAAGALEAGIEGASLCALVEANVAAVSSSTCLPGGVLYTDASDAAC